MNNPQLHDKSKSMNYIVVVQTIDRTLQRQDLNSKWDELDKLLTEHLQSISAGYDNKHFNIYPHSDTSYRIEVIVNGILKCPQIICNDPHCKNQ